MRNKKPARRNIGLELDEKVIRMWQSEYSDVCELHQVDAIAYLEEFSYTGQELVYVDPPYVPETRRRSKVYRHDYSKEDHLRLLKCLIELPCKVMLSGYECDLYNDALIGWNKVTFPAKTHVGLRDETVWMNFEPPTQLHDTRYLGDSFRERQNVKRRQSRLRNRIEKMDPVERHDLLQWMHENYGATEGAF